MYPPYQFDQCPRCRKRGLYADGTDRDPLSGYPTVMRCRYCECEIPFPQAILATDMNPPTDETFEFETDSDALDFQGKYYGPIEFRAD